MTGPFDSGDYRDSEPLSVVPTALTQNILQERSEEESLCDVVAYRPVLDRRADNALMTGRSVDEPPRTESRSSIRVHDATSEVTASDYCVAQGAPRVRPSPDHR